MEILLDILLWIVGQIISDILLALTADIGVRRIRRSGKKAVASAPSAISYVGAGAFGVATALLSWVIFPYTFNVWPVPGFSLLCAPFVIGWGMQRIGAWRIALGTEPTVFSTYWGASTMAFCFALTRFLLTR